MQYSIVIDFDGTITTEDVAEYILIHFATGDWKAVEKRAVAGEITMDECMRQQYGMIKGSPAEIMAKSKDIGLRDGFIDFYHFVREAGMDMQCVSAGLSFVIDTIFDDHGIDLDIIAPSARLTADGIDLELVEFPDGFTDFKHYHVDSVKQQGNRVIYIGDGTSDYGGIVHADRRYTVAGSSLSRLCENEGLTYTEFTSFDEIIDDLKTYLSSRL